MRQVDLTAAAWRDLLLIDAHLRAENPARADTVVDALIERCDSLGELSHRYPLVPRHEHWGIRRCVHGAYLIFYRLRTEAVEIVHILHGASDYESVLFPD
jgi:toxin ParE1/3/4